MLVQGFCKNACQPLPTGMATNFSQYACIASRCSRAAPLNQPLSPSGNAAPPLFPAAVCSKSGPQVFFFILLRCPLLKLTGGSVRGEAGCGAAWQVNERPHRAITPLRRRPLPSSHGGALRGWLRIVPTEFFVIEFLLNSCPFAVFSPTSICCCLSVCLSFFSFHVSFSLC